MSDRTRVLVVIVNYRSSRFLERLLTSVLAEPEVAAVVVHDNGSGATEVGALDALRGAFPTVCFETGGGNVGFGAGVNAAVRESPIDDWDAVWVVNPDAAARPGALAGLVEAAADRDWAIVSPLIVAVADDGTETVWFAGGTVDLQRGRSTHEGIGGDPAAIEWATREVDFVTGAAPLIRRDAWDALRGFGEQFFLYWEDADLCLRAARAGYHMGVVRDAVVAHWQGGSSGGEASPVYCYYIQRNRLWLLPTARMRMRVAFVSGRRTTRNHLLFAVRGSDTRARSAWASVRGIAAGIRGPRERAAPSGRR